MAVSLAASADGVARHGQRCRVRRNVDETEHGESLLLAGNGQRREAHAVTRAIAPGPGPGMQSSMGMWCGAALRSACAGLGPWGLLGSGCNTGVGRLKAAAPGGAMPAQAAGHAGSSESGAWATTWCRQVRPRLAGCQRPHGQGPARLKAAMQHARRVQRQAPPHAGKGGADPQQKNAWPLSLAGRAEHADADGRQGAPSQQAGHAPAKGARPVQTAQMQQSGKTVKPPTLPWPTGAHGVQQGLGETGPELAQGNPRPGSGRQEAWQAAAVTACWGSLQQLALSTLRLRK